MTEGRYWRQLGWYNPDEHPGDSVTFVGVGGIGSFAAFGAAKLGVPKIEVIDPDEVEAHNQPNQFYSTSDVGGHKVHCLVDRLSEDHENIFGTAGYGQEELRSGVIVSGLDSMEARMALWNQAIKLKPQVSLYLDARLGGQIIVIYAVNPTDMHDIEQYEITLYSDEEAEDAPCTERGVIDVGLMVGSVLTRHLRSHFTGGEVPRQTIINQETLTITKAGWNE